MQQMGESWREIRGDRILKIVGLEMVDSGKQSRNNSKTGGRKCRVKK